jgi:hypothetical protein
VVGKAFEFCVECFHVTVLHRSMHSVQEGTLLVAVLLLLVVATAVAATLPFLT